jgi:thiol-disulfide isomerase/thioredoxin
MNRTWLWISLGVALLAGGSKGADRTAPELIVGGQWLNSPPLKLSAQRGKVVIVNIWVHSCINCHNSLPTLKAWYAKYKDQGLEIIGVHTPEFASDKDLPALRESLKADGVTWPVMQDNASATWKAYNNQYWPAFYLVDKRGVIRETHDGEISSRYPDAIPGLEATLKKLLAEKAAP